MNEIGRTCVFGPRFGFCGPLLMDKAGRIDDKIGTRNYNWKCYSIEAESFVVMPSFIPTMLLKLKFTGTKIYQLEFLIVEKTLYLHTGP